MLIIKEVCKKSGITLKELAKRLNISYQSLHTIMTGNPTIKTLGEIADILDVEVFDLFERKRDLLICRKCKANAFSFRQVSISEVGIFCNNCGEHLDKNSFDKYLYFAGYRTLSKSGKVHKNR